MEPGVDRLSDGVGKEAEVAEFLEPRRTSENARCTRPGISGGVVARSACFVTERIIVSPGAGVFSPVPGLEAGAVIDAGSLVGTVGHLEVRSPFAGQLMGFLAVATERVTSSEPIAWLRTG